MKWKIELLKKGLFERSLKVKKNGIFLCVISPLVPEIFKIFVLCKLGTDDVIRWDNTPYSQMATNLGRARDQTWSRGILG